MTEQQRNLICNVTSRRVLGFLFAAALALAAGAIDGKAYAAAYCAYAGGRAGYENCGYHSWEQCLAAVGGRGGQCMRNPHDPAVWRARPNGKAANRRATPPR